MKSFLTFILIIFSLQGNLNQEYSKEILIDLYLRQNLESDVYYYLDFDKEDVPKAEFFYFKKEIPFNLKILERDSKSTIKTANFSELSNKKSISNYVVFNTGFIDNTIVMEIFFNREYFLNTPGNSEYETWRKQNGGINYLFEFDKEGRLINSKKKPILYE